MAKKENRKQQILEALAIMLEEGPTRPITTAKLAKKVGVSEAALYRHFPSKTNMFESLILFIEETLFSRITLIKNKSLNVEDQCYQILTLILTFAEKNPGISCILSGDALVGELDRLSIRVNQLFDRIDTQIKQLLREAEITESIRPNLPISAASQLLLTVCEGKIRQFVRGRFKHKPTENWSAQWQVIMQGFFKKTMSVNISN